MTLPAIPAASLILFRQAADDRPEILMLERSAAMTFAPGALVFPGGRVDPGDVRIGGDADGAARIAALRETLEEAGIAIGLDPAPTPDATLRIRVGLAAGLPFDALLSAEGLAPAPDKLIPFARWCPNFRETRRFDARFYLAEVPAGTMASADGSECVAARWAPAAVFAADPRPIFPTRRILERLARHDSFDSAVADARRHPIRTITPWIETRDGQPWLVIPDDLGYPVTAEPLATARRG